MTLITHKHLFIIFIFSLASVVVPFYQSNLGVGIVSSIILGVLGGFFLLLNTKLKNIREDQKEAKIVAINTAKDLAAKKEEEDRKMEERFAYIFKTLEELKMMPPCTHPTRKPDNDKST